MKNEKVNHTKENENVDITNRSGIYSESKDSNKITSKKCYELEYDIPAMLFELEKLTNISSNAIDLNDKETLALFLHANDKNYNKSTRGVPEFGADFSRKILGTAKPRNFNDLVYALALINEKGTKHVNFENLIKNDRIEVNKVIIESTKNAFKIAWYKVHYPQAFYKAYFKIISNLNIKKYYNIAQINRELNRLYDEKEIYTYNKDFNYNIINNDKINDLEILLEMYNCGILKEKEEIKDNYNLINSRGIADYCRSINHEFNTEELAVLVYRNRRMSIEEKIKKYKDLINNYPDMEVIERINCKHYKSVKSMIKNEIERLEKLYKEFIANDKDAIFSWTEFNKSTKNWTCSDLITNAKKTYKEIKRIIKSYINEYNDTISFRIIKKYFNRNEKIIYAEYNVIDKKIKLINIFENENDFLDIDNIFLNIPTPFKKGDILVSNCNSMHNYGDNGEIFVLDYLCTWRNNLNEYLAKGNYDSSDMIAYGYYLYEDNSTEFVCDHKWDYDSFEYYDGILEGNNRILKDISSFLKGKIGLELFVHAYDAYKAENTRKLPEFYTDNGLKLAGFNELDILKENHHSEKIYNMSENEKNEYLKRTTHIFDKFKKQDIIQIETNFYNDIYILTFEGVLYKTGEYDEELEKIDEKIKRIHMFDGTHLYKITMDNIILPIEDDKEWDDKDIYLNNNNCKYKKIEISLLHIILLTSNGEVRAIHGYPTGLGIITDNFKDVEDITIVVDEEGIDIPFIYKNSEYIKLYID